MEDNLFDDYNDEDNYLLNEIVRIFSSRYGFCIETSTQIVKDSFVVGMILGDSVFIHHKDTSKLVNDIYQEKFGVDY